MTTPHHTKTHHQPIWMFMAATAMATTVSTLAATAMVQADTAEPIQVECACASAKAECPAPAVAPEAESAQQPSAEAPAVAPEPEPEPVVTAARTPKPKAMGVEGQLDKSIIRRIVRAHINEVRYCYNEGLEDDPDLAGKVVVQMTISGSTGKVDRAEVTSTTLDDDGDVAECIAKAAARWKFPKPANAKNVIVTYPFVLEPG